MNTVYIVLLCNNHHHTMHYYYDMYTSILLLFLYTPTCPVTCHSLLPPPTTSPAIEQWLILEELFLSLLSVMRVNTAILQTITPLTWLQKLYHIICTALRLTTLLPRSVSPVPSTYAPTPSPHQIIMIDATIHFQLAHTNVLSSPFPPCGKSCSRSNQPYFVSPIR